MVQQFARRAFAVAGTTAWNFVPDYIRQSDNSTIIYSFMSALRIFFVCTVLALSA